MEHEGIAEVTLDSENHSGRRLGGELATGTDGDDQIVFGPGEWDRASRFETRAESEVWGDDGHYVDIPGVGLVFVSGDCERPAT